MQKINKAVKLFRGLLTVGAASVAAVVLASTALAADPLLGISELRVHTQSGFIRGQNADDGKVQKWLGIPYAEPPIGEHRWQAPLPHSAWKDERQANKFGNACTQVGGFYGPTPAGKPWGKSNVENFGKSVGSEDCLTLNIWRPQGAENGLPVIVFMHGGSNVVGYSGDPLYDGAKLAVGAHALVVTVNYRLGIFGWFTHPALESKDPLTNSGNFGTLDIIQALHFIQANAAAFGGDPKNVTVMGQSAGAKDVYSLIGSSLTDGLFQKAIVLSGLVTKGFSKEKGYEYSSSLIEQSVIDDQLAKTPSEAEQLLANKGLAWQSQYLKSKSAEELIALTSRHTDLRKVPREFNDGVVRPSDLPAAFEEGKFHTVPTIVGMTNDESKLLFDYGIKVDRQTRFAMMMSADSSKVPEIKLTDVMSSYLLPALGPWLYNATHSVTSAYLQHLATKGISKQAEHDSRVFAYQFNWNNAPEPWKTIYGSCHGIDLPFIFGNFSSNVLAMDFSETNKSGREALSLIMMKTIKAFVRTGDPNNDALPARWYPWGANGEHKKRLLFNASDLAPEITGN